MRLCAGRLRSILEAYDGRTRRRREVIVLDTGPGSAGSVDFMMLFGCHAASKTPPLYRNLADAFLAATGFLAGCLLPKFRTGFKAFDDPRRRSRRRRSACAGPAGRIDCLPMRLIPGGAGAVSAVRLAQSPGKRYAKANKGRKAGLFLQMYRDRCVRRLPQKGWM